MPEADIKEDSEGGDYSGIILPGLEILPWQDFFFLYVHNALMYSEDKAFKSLVF